MLKTLGRYMIDLIEGRRLVRGVALPTELSAISFLLTRMRQGSARIMPQQTHMQWLTADGPYRFL